MTWMEAGVGVITTIAGIVGVILIAVNALVLRAATKLVGIVWEIKTNDLPHIETRLADLTNQFAAHDKWERETKLYGATAADSPPSDSSRSSF